MLSVPSYVYTVIYYTQTYYHTMYDWFGMMYDCIVLLNGNLSQNITLIPRNTIFYMPLTKDSRIKHIKRFRLNLKIEQYDRTSLSWNRHAGFYSEIFCFRLFA